MASQKLILHNTLEYNLKENILYYLLFTAEQLKMDLNEFPVFVRGRLDPQDEIYELLYCYVRYAELEKHIPIFKTTSKLLQENYLLLFSL